MIIKYNDLEYVVDPEIDFKMLRFCYHAGCNCYTCIESDLCDVSIEELLEHGELVQ